MTTRYVKLKDYASLVSPGATIQERIDMTYTLKLGRTYNLGDFNSKRLDIERIYPDEKDSREAIIEMSEELNELHIATHLDREAIRKALGKMDNKQ